MLCLAGNFVSDETVSSVINLIVSTPELSLYAVHKLFIAMRSNLGQEGLIKVGVYILGELGDVLISNPVTGPENETISVSEQEVINLIDEINTRKYHPGVKEYLMNCYLKLITKFSSTSSDHLKFLLEQETRSYHCEVQHRASEYLTFSQAADPSLKREITKNVPNSKITKESEVKK
jgi:AP-1 complex subunit gamma-1